MKGIKMKVLLRPTSEFLLKAFMPIFDVAAPLGAAGGALAACRTNNNVVLSKLPCFG